MKIKIRWGNKMIKVDVNYPECRKRECFVPGKYVHTSACGMSGTSSRTADEYSCLTRDNHGCPDKYCTKRKAAE